MKIKSYLGILIVCFLAVAGCLQAVNAQPKQVLVEGGDFTIYTDSGLAFQTDLERILTIEVLTGTWGGENCRVGITERGGNLYFVSNETCEFQLYNSYEHSIRLQYEGFGLSVIEQGYTYNGTLPAGDVPCFLDWSWGFELPHETYFMLYVGLFGIGLLIVSLLLMAYEIKTYPIFSLGKKEILFDKLSFILCIAGVVIGLGLIITWLMA